MTKPHTLKTATWNTKTDERVRKIPRERERSRHGTALPLYWICINLFLTQTHANLWDFEFVSEFVVASSGRILHRMVIVGGRFLNLNSLCCESFFLYDDNAPTQIKWCVMVLLNGHHHFMANDQAIDFYRIHKYCRNHNFVFCFLSCSYAHLKYLLASMYILQLIKTRTKPNVAKNAPNHKPKFISSNIVMSVIVDLLLQLVSGPFYLYSFCFFVVM